MPSYEEYGFPGRPRRFREQPATWPAILILFAIFVIGGLAIGYFAFRGQNRNAHDADVKLREVAPRGERDPFERERIRVFKDVSPSVVNVDTLRVNRGQLNGISERPLGTGSGFVWDAEGRIVTNFHVVRETLQITAAGGVSIMPTATVRVIMADRTAWNARLVGVAPDNDLAVIQVDAPTANLKPIPVGTSSDLEVGQTVYAIGNPFGQSLTFTHGIVSALDREIQSATDRPITGVIQTDASLNPGNSGGPLLDREGRLIGVNTAITSPSGGNVGLGYAIPVDTVNQVVTDLIRNGRTARPSLGIKLLRDRDTRALHFDQGVMIGEVLPGSTAAKAGLTAMHFDPATSRPVAGDVIVAINGEPIKTVADYLKMLGKLRVQQTVTLTIRRGDETQDVKVTLEGI